MKADRPKLALQKTGTDLLVERLTFLILICMWINVIVSYRSLPQVIPVHFDFSGKPDRYDNKFMIFLLPFIVTIIFAGLYFLCGYPHKFNYPSVITVENAEKQYRLSTRLIRVINLIVVVAFSYITVKVIHDSKQPGSILDWWFVPVLILALLLPTGYYIYRSMKLKK